MARCLTSCIPAGSTTPLLGCPGDPFLLLPFIFGFPEQCFAFPCLFSKRAVERRFSRWRGRVEPCKSRVVNSGSFFMLSGKRVANCHQVSQRHEQVHPEHTRCVADIRSSVLGLKAPGLARQAYTHPRIRRHWERNCASLTYWTSFSFL